MLAGAQHKLGTLPLRHPPAASAAAPLGILTAPAHTMRFSDCTTRKAWRGRHAPATTTWHLFPRWPRLIVAVFLLVATCCLPTGVADTATFAKTVKAKLPAPAWRVRPSHTRGASTRQKPADGWIPGAAVPAARVGTAAASSWPPRRHEAQGLPQRTPGRTARAQQGPRGQGRARVSSDRQRREDTLCAIRGCDSWIFAAPCNCDPDCSLYACATQCTGRYVYPPPRYALALLAHPCQCITSLRVRAAGLGCGA